LRGQKNQQIISTWNPISGEHWIKKQELDTTSWTDLPVELKNIPYSKLSKNSFVRINKERNAILIKTTYLDNYWIVGHPDLPEIGFKDIHVLADFEHDKNHDIDSYNIYALAEWGHPPQGLIFQYKKNWFKYTDLPDFDFFETYGLDFGGGGVNEKRKCYPNLLEFDEADGSSTTVLVRLLINKASMSCYVKLLLYKAYISPDELSQVCTTYCIESDGHYIKKKHIIADNARADKIRDLLNNGLSVIGAKTKEGGSGRVNSGIDIIKKYKIYFHEEDIPCHLDGNNYKWETNQQGEMTGNPVKKFENVWDAVRYPLINFDLYNW
jgi:phage terminase large subunit